GTRRLRRGAAPGRGGGGSPRGTRVCLRGEEPVGLHERIGLGRLPASARGRDRREIGHELLLCSRRDACIATRNGCWNVKDAIPAALRPQMACRLAAADSRLATSTWPEAVSGT